MNNRIIFKNSIILYVRLILTSLFGIVSSRILLNALGVDDFGLYAVVAGVVLMINLLNTVFISTSFRFIAFELGKEDAGDVNKVYNVSLAVHLLMACLLLVIAETGGTFYINHYLRVSPARLPEALFVFHISVIAAVLSIVSIPFQALITAKENFFIRSLIEIFAAAVKLAAAYIILKYAGDRLIFYAELILVATAGTSLFYIIYCGKAYKKFIAFKFSKDWKLYKEFFKFSTWIMFGAAASVGKVQGTALIINSFFGTVLNAAFGLANQLNTFLLMFSQNVGQAAIPQITKSYSSGDIDRSKNLAAAISKISFFLMLIPIIPLLFKTRFILTIWLKELPDYIVIFSKLMMINALIETSGAGIPAAIHATGKIKLYQIILSCNTLAALPISYLFYKYNFPPQIIIVVFIVVSLINNIIAQFFLKFTIGFELWDYFKRVYLGIIAVVISLLPVYLLSEHFSDNLLSLISFSLFSTIWIIMSVYFVGLTRNEKKQVKSIGTILYQKLRPVNYIGKGN